MSLIVSVIIPVYNLENYILCAIESILIQNYLNLEIIIVDDGSTDSTEKKVLSLKAPHIKYVKQSHCGAASARNAGVKISKGKFIAFLDADDIWLPNKLLAQMALFKKNPHLDMVFTHIKEFISPELIEDKEKAKLPNRVLPGYCTSCILIKRKAFLKVGYFNPERHVGEFLEWYLKSKFHQLKEEMLDSVLVQRRIHNSNTSKLNQNFRTDYVKILHAHMTRGENEPKTSLHLAQ